jgi:hypothetical protein
VTDNKTCTVCWGTDDLADHPSWDAKSTYSIHEVSGTTVAEPFKLDDADKVCKIQCLPDYWSNAKSTYGRASIGNDQRCTYNNCKNWDYEGGVTDNKTCTVCWGTDDLADHPSWDAKSTYSIHEVSGTIVAEPFKLDDADKVCKIQCLPDYWSNAKSTYGRASNGNDQRCTYNNCKRTSIGPIDIEPTTKFATEKTEAEISVYDDNKGITMEVEKHTEFAMSFSPNKVGTSQMLITGLTIDYRTKKAI